MYVGVGSLFATTIFLSIEITFPLLGAVESHSFDGLKVTLGVPLESVTLSKQSILLGIPSVVFVTEIVGFRQFGR